jgi:hypothetical protein
VLVSQVINTYLSAIRGLFTEYIGTEDKFNRIAGQENKMKLLQFFIYEDEMMVEKLKPYMELLRLECWPTPVLLPGPKFDTTQVQYHQMMRHSVGHSASPVTVRTYKDHLSKLSSVVCLNEFLEWYGRDLVLETQRWLARTLNSALLTRKNEHKLPWDLESSTGMFRSGLPEDLRYFANKTHLMALFSVFFNSFRIT